MPAKARLYILNLDLPGQDVMPAGVLLEDRAQDRLHLRLRRDWEEIAPDEAEVLSAIAQDLESKAHEVGAEALLVYLQDTLSNILRLGGGEEIEVENFERDLGRYYRQNVRSAVIPFVTHIPRYSLAVAAGKFLENQEVSEEAWEEVTPGLKPVPGMFAARIEGHSMEPLIPDGSLCVFRSGVTGSRQGRLLLVEALGRGANDRHTVKRYHSEKSQASDGAWTHQRIRLEPLNPDFEAWNLDPEEDRYRIVAEFVAVLD